MNLPFSLLIAFSLLLSATAKPGGTYVLTGREKSVFSIYQADMKTFPDLYEGEDVNEYYKTFKSLNNLDGRKLKRGEELQFPHTKKSKELHETEIAKAAREAKRAQAAARAKETAASAPEKQEGEISLFGSDRRSSGTVSLDPEEQKAKKAAYRKSARHKAVHYFQHTLLPKWLFDYNRNTMENILAGNVDELITRAQLEVDEPFAKAIVLHAYPGKNLYILEFENPVQVDEYFFLAIKQTENGQTFLYALAKGISFFGAGEVSKLSEWKFGGISTDLGGRSYKDLASFIQELETGRPVSSGTE